jgi:ArsR family transcriptional regulator, arsenate/arsenite/antimonite-responsive transcriptional repressor
MRIGSTPVETLPTVDCCTPLAGSTLSAEGAVGLERLFKALADRNRLRILNVLLEAAGEAVCVCEFQPTLGISQPTVSHHLKQLVQAGLLEREKRGTFAYYRLAPGGLERIRGLLADSPTLVTARRRARAATPVR